MDIDLKSKWVAALRSGQYEQGEAELRAADHGHYKFCCLGVLADVCGANWPSNRVGAMQIEDDDENYLHPEFANFVGLRKDQQETLARLNDGFDEHMPTPFNGIADYIEKNL